MKTLSKSKFKKAIQRLETINYTDMVALQDEVGNVVEFDTTGNERHEIQDVLCIDGDEFKLTESQKDIFFGMAYDAQTYEANDAFTPEDYTHFTNLIYT